MKDERSSFELEARIENEISIMEKLRHENIIRLISFDNDVKYRPNPIDDSSHKVDAIAMELAENGQMFDFILTTGRFTEDIARYYFHELISVVKYMHEEGIAHRDIKLEHLWFDRKFSLKLIGFVLSTEDWMSPPKVGTTRYLAPEAHEGEYDGMKADLFACGVCLFMMVARRNPFHKASKDDKGYAPFLNGNPEQFWENQLKQMDEDGDFFSEDFKELVNGLLNANIEERWDIDDIRESNWMREDVLRDEEVIEEMKERKSNLNSSRGGEMPDRLDEDDMNSIFSKSSMTR